MPASARRAPARDDLVEPAEEAFEDGAQRA
jgi:hypothetical protein